MVESAEAGGDVERTGCTRSTRTGYRSRCRVASVSLTLPDARLRRKGDAAGRG